MVAVIAESVNKSIFAFILYSLQSTTESAYIRHYSQAIVKSLGAIPAGRGAIYLI